VIITKHPRDLKPGDRFLRQGKVLTVGPDGVREYVRIPLFGGEFLAMDPEASVDVLDKEEVNQGLLARTIQTFGNEETARRWLATRNLALSTKTPEEFARMGIEACNKVFAILNQIDQGGVF
jgi:hypothetical protein